MESFWTGFTKEANAATAAFKGLAKATKAPKSVAAGENVLNYAKINAPKPAAAAPTLDYGAMAAARKAERGVAETASGTFDYSQGLPKQTQAPAPIMRTPAKPRGVAALHPSQQARIQQATKGSTTATDWNDALKR